MTGVQTCALPICHFFCCLKSVRLACCVRGALLLLAMLPLNFSRKYFQASRGWTSPQAVEQVCNWGVSTVRSWVPLYRCQVTWRNVPGVTWKSDPVFKPCPYCCGILLYCSPEARQSIGGGSEYNRKLSRQKKKYSAEFKVQAVLELLRGDKALSKLAEQY